MLCLIHLCTHFLQVHRITPLQQHGSLATSKFKRHAFPKRYHHRGGVATNAPVVHILPPCFCCWSAACVMLQGLATSWITITPTMFKERRLCATAVVGKTRFAHLPNPVLFIPPTPPTPLAGRKVSYACQRPGVPTANSQSVLLTQLRINLPPQTWYSWLVVAWGVFG